MRPRLRHYFTHYQSLGGVQSILRAHLKHDPERDLETSLLAFFDPSGPNPDDSRIGGLGLTGRHSIHQARRRFADAESCQQYDVPIFHDLWGLAFLGEFDQSPHRRIGAVHSHWPHLGYQLDQLQGSLDGVFCDSQEIADYVMARHPALTEERVRHLPVPTQIAPQEMLSTRDPIANRRIVLGFVGRVDFAQKRVDRFPALLACLRQQGLDCELQFLGSGDASKSLPSRFDDQEKVTFWGRQSGDHYWKIMGQWDFVIYTSDHEGSPLAMIEAMSAGNIPIFPKIGSGGDRVVSKIDPTLLYPPEDWLGVAAILKAWTQRSDQSLTESRAACRQLSQGHASDAYHERFMSFLNRVLELPRISGEFTPDRPFYPTDHLPFGLLTRLNPKGYYRANPLTPYRSKD